MKSHFHQFPVRSFSFLVAASALLQAAACQPPSYVQLEIGVDRTSVSANVDTIGIGLATESEYRLSRQLTVADVNRLRGGELTVTVTSDSGQRERLLVEGLTQTSTGFQIVGRAVVDVDFGTDRTKAVTLRHPCDGEDHPVRSNDIDARCGDDVTACNGRTQVCVEQVCQCPAPFCGDRFTDVTTEECDDGNLNPNDGCDRCALTQWSPEIVLGLGANASGPNDFPLDYPVDVATTDDGVTYVVDQTAGRVYRVHEDRVSLFAGNGRGVYSPTDEGMPAALAGVEFPVAVAVDGFQRVFIAEAASGGFNPRVRVVDNRGKISTYADTDTVLSCPVDLTAEQDGTLYVADCNDVIWMVPPNGGPSTRIAGTGDFLIPDNIGDGGPATSATFMGIGSLASDGRGRLYVTEQYGNRIRVIEGGRVATVVGSTAGIGGFAGDGGPARLARIYGPSGIHVDADGTIIFADAYNYRIRKVTPDGIIRTLAGDGLPLDGADGLLAIETSFIYPLGIARRSDGSLLIADSASRKVRAIAPGTPLVSTVLGQGRAVDGGDGELATSATFRAPFGLALSGDALFIADPDANRVRAVNLSNNIVRAMAGSGELDSRGESAFSGDGDFAYLAQLNEPLSVAYSPDDEALFIADTANRRLRRVDANGKIETVVGGGTIAVPTTAQNAKELLVTPAGVTLAVDGRVFFSDRTSSAIVRFDAEGTAARVAGTQDGEAEEVDGPAIQTRLRLPGGLFVDENDDSVVFADEGSHLIRKIDLASGAMTTLAGGQPLLEGAHADGYAPYLDFSGPATRASFGGPGRVTLDAAGNIYFSDRYDQRIRRISPDGIVTVIAGRGQDPYSGGIRGFNGDDLLGTETYLNTPEGLSVYGNKLYFADRFNQRIRALDFGTGRVETVAGNLEFPVTSVGSFGGDGGLAIDAQLYDPSDVVVQRNALLIADSLNGRIRRVDLATGIITTYAGGGILDPLAGPLAEEALLTCPTGLAIGPDESVYIAESCLHRIWRIDSLSGRFSHVAGTGASGNAGDGGSARAARLSFPVDLIVADTGEVYIADEGNNRIRVVELDGTIRSFTAPTSYPAFGGDGRSVNDARLSFPSDIAFGPDGALYIADAGNRRIRRVSPPSEGPPRITTVGGAAAPGDGGQAQQALLHYPSTVIADGSGGFYIADTGHLVVRHVDIAGRISTVAGTGAYPFKSRAYEEGALGVETALTGPTGLALKGQSLYISDADSERVRKLDLGTGVMTTVAGLVDPGSGAFESAQLELPNALEFGERGLFVAQGDGRVRFVDEEAQRVRTVIGTDGAIENESPITADRARLFRDAAGVAYDIEGKVLYVTERDGHGIRVVEVNAIDDESTWLVRNYSGTAETPDHLDGPLDRARFRNPTGLAFDATTRTLYVADTGNHVIRAIDVEEGTVSTPIGVPEELGDAPDNTRANVAHLNAPEGLAVNRDGTLFIADTGNHVIRRVAGNVVTKVLGDGQNASSGEGRPSRAFPVDSPRGLRVDDYGNLFVTSRTALRVVVAEKGVVSGDSAVLTIYGSPSDPQYPEDITQCLSDVIVTGPERDDLTTATSDAELFSLVSGEDRVLLIDACQGMLVEVVRRRTQDVPPALDAAP